MTPWHFDDVF